MIYKKQKLETAITALIELLRTGIEDEDMYQAWFEDNPIVFEILGYKDFIAHPRLKYSNQANKVDIPDFLVQELDGTWKVFEIKRPDAKLVRSNKRSDFYASLFSYINQALSYSEYFDDSQHRDYFEETYSKQIHKKPNAIVVAGMNTGLDRQMLHEKLSRFDRTSVVTYEDILELLEFKRSATYGEFEGKSGFLIAIMLQIYPMPQGHINHILSVGIDSQDHFTLYIDNKKRVCISLKDTDGNIQTLKTSNHVIHSDKTNYLLVQAGFNGADTLVSMNVNDEYTFQHISGFEAEKPSEN